MKYFYYVIDIGTNGKRYAETVRIAQCNNLKRAFEGFGNVEYIYPCASKKEAEAIAEAWNEFYKRNGTYGY